MKKLGLIVNPWAGLGGHVGLKGSDGVDTVERALALGAVTETPARAVHALEALRDVRQPFELYTYEGDMGANELWQLGYEPIVIGSPMGSPSAPAANRNIINKQSRRRIKC